jgi:hypothetical protein
MLCSFLISSMLALCFGYLICLYFIILIIFND